MEITGEVTDIIYQNELNSYTVAEFETEEGDITIVGYLPFISVGDTLKLVGKLVTHQDYGEQFKVDTFEKMMPKSLSALERFLANGTIKGVGPATAKKIVNTFKDETMHVLKFEPDKLMQIKGITYDKAHSISETFLENMELWQIVGYLEKFGIGVQNAKNVHLKLGTNAIEEIEKNPYILIDVANNVDFKKLDRMALENGVALNYRERIKSGIKYAMISASVNGNCRVQKDNLILYCTELLGVTDTEIEENLIDLKALNQIIEENDWIYLAAFYNAEKNIAEKLVFLQDSPNLHKVSNIKKELKKVEKNSDIELSSMQKEAIEKINENNVCIITGGPGTGKTTIIKAIIDIYESYNKKVVLCAPTGRAAKRMTETTGKEAKTLHRMLEIGKIEDENKIDTIDKNVEPLSADIVIVDEMSMVDIFLMNYLVKALFQGTKLVLVGDVDQLPSVGPGSILKDIINSETITTITLKEIFRQAAKSKIILNSHRVNQGESFLSKEEIEEELDEDFFYINETNQEKILNQVVSLCNGRLQNYGDYDFFKNIQVITPTKKGMLGTKELNKTLQKFLNPESEYLKEKQFGDVVYREKDRVMQIKNNYDIIWEKDNNEHEIGAGVFNGELGTIEKIDEEERQIQIRFDDDKVAIYQFQDLDQIEHSYSITIHKAQGSEFDVVIMVVPQSAPVLLTRNLLYTGMTRAKKMLIVIGNNNIIDFMIQNVDVKKRNTGLEEKLKNLS